MMDASLPSGRRLSGGNTLKAVIDILMVVCASLVAYVLEDVAASNGWIAISSEAKGVSGVLAGALAAVGIVVARGGSFADLGFRRPERWARVPLQVAAILIVFIVAQALVPVLVSSFVAVPAPDLSKYDAIAGNPGAALLLALVLPVTASIPEEIIYRGFLMGRLSSVFGLDMRGNVMTVLIQALFFGSVHFAWGIGGMAMTFIMGLVWGTAYILCGRNLWIVIFAHSAGHLLFVTQLYMGTSLIV